jgi:hypothetical protein
VAVLVAMAVMAVVMPAASAPAFADKPFWLCTFEGVTFTATTKAAQEIKREEGRGTCEMVHLTH